MQNTGTVVGSAHSAVRDPHHVAYAGFEQLLGDWQVPPFWHSWTALGSRVAQNQYAVLVHLQIGIINPGIHFVVAVKDNRPPRMFHQPGVGSYSLDDRALGSQIAVQDHQP